MFFFKLNARKNTNYHISGHYLKNIEKKKSIPNAYNNMAPGWEIFINLKGINHDKLDFNVN